MTNDTSHETGVQLSLQKKSPAASRRDNLNVSRLQATNSKISQSAASSTDMESHYNDPKKFQSQTVGDATPETGKKPAMKYRSLHRKGSQTVRPTLKIAENEKDEESEEEERAAPNLVIQPMSVANNTYEPAKDEKKDVIPPQIEK